MNAIAAAKPGMAGHDGPRADRGSGTDLHVLVDDCKCADLHVRRELRAGMNDGGRVNVHARGCRVLPGGSSRCCRKGVCSGPKPLVKALKPCDIIYEVADRNGSGAAGRYGATVQTARPMLDAPSSKCTLRAY